MKLKLLKTSSICLLLSISCCSKRINSISSGDEHFEISYSSLSERIDSNERFYLFIYAPWCNHCKASIPLVKNKFMDRNDAFYLNGETMSIDEHMQLKTSYISAMQNSDALLSSSSQRVLYPTIGLYKERKLVYAKSGLPKTQKNIDLLIDQLDNEY